MTPPANSSPVVPAQTRGVEDREAPQGRRPAPRGSPWPSGWQHAVLGARASRPELLLSGFGALAQPQFPYL